MDYFGLNGPADLPRIKEVLQEAVVQPTLVTNTVFEESETLVVSEEGELLQRDERAEDGPKLFLDGQETSSAAQQTDQDISSASDSTNAAIINGTNDDDEDAAAGADGRGFEDEKETDDLTPSDEDSTAEQS